MTLVNQSDSGAKRIIGVIKDRDTAALTGFFEFLDPER